MSMRWHYIYIAFIYTYVCLKNNKYILNIDTATNWTYSHFRNQIKANQWERNSECCFCEAQHSRELWFLPWLGTGNGPYLSCGVHLSYNGPVSKVTSSCSQPPWMPCATQTEQELSGWWGRLASGFAMEWETEGREASPMADIKKRKTNNGQHVAARS